MSATYDPQTANGAYADGLTPAQAPQANGAAAQQGPDQQLHPLTNGHAQQNGSSRALDIICGPLINYKRTSNGHTANPRWHGSVLIVTKPASGAAPAQPELCLKHIRAINSDAQPEGGHQETTFQGERLYEDTEKAFFRFVIDVPILDYEANWQYSLVQSSNVSPKVFTVPSKSQSMRILFHSCNGFSVGTDEEEWNGPVLWNDVLRTHTKKAFHVMIGGGDQIYNDNVRVTGPLKEWTSISNPHKRKDYPFGEKLRDECDQHYFNNYIRWYGTEPFKSANSIIPQVNIWDDHDIIDGFGSYTDHFMRCHVFRGIGGVAHKYYVLFQHHIAPPNSTFTTDAKVTQSEGGAPDPVQAKHTYVLEEKEEDPSYIIGAKPGPYVEERSRSILTQLGARIGFLGIDARQERTRHQINYPETYDQLFTKLQNMYKENSELKHLIVLLGVPIAYPRLIWLENIFTSPLIAPLRLLNKRFGFAGGLFNKFDGQVDLLDDLDDHYTARQHKKERRLLMQRLQAFAKENSVRVTILGGDVHLAAIGRFYSKPAAQIPAERDWRYMVNIISSAITNKPPPQAVANLLAKRNKIHHLDHDTDETLLEFFDHDPGHTPEAIERRQTLGENKAPSKKTSNSNKVTMPSRNYAIISESNPEISVEPDAPGANGILPHTETSDHPAASNGGKFNTRKPIHEGEKAAGTTHRSATGLEASGLGGKYGLDVTIMVEIDNHDPEGKTEGYAMTIPGLDCKGYEASGTKW